MSEYRTGLPYEEESSLSSDEKMESLRSQDTPNSTLSSDFDERSEPNVLRLQDPAVLRLSAPETNHNTQKELSEGFINQMSNLHLQSPVPKTLDHLKPTVNSNLENRPKNLGISPPKFSTSLVLTTSHPLMNSPDRPDVIPKKDKERNLSLSSFEDDRPSETNGFSMYSLNTNNSKNNLYFGEQFATAESQVLSEAKGDDTPPDVAKVKLQGRKSVSGYVESQKKMDMSSINKDSPHRVVGRVVDGHGDEAAILKYIEERNKKLTNHSTPKLPEDSDAGDRVGEWCESTQTRRATTFELPIELSRSVTVNNDLESPDVVSSSSQGSRSLYQALVDPATGRAALRPTATSAPSAPDPAPRPHRRLIVALEDEDSCSLDSLSVSMDLEDEPPELDPEQAEPPNGEGEESKRSKSSNTCSEGSDPIPEYSATEELHNERYFMSVDTGDSFAICDMKVIEPYKRVLSHGGYDPQGSAIVVFSACHLPDTHRPDYRYVMDNLFLYVMWTLDFLIGTDYVLVYLHGSAEARRLPSFRWLHECYRLIDRRLRKSLKHLYLVHPTFWLKSFVMLTKPFVSSKFFRKLTYVPNLAQLQQLVPVEPNAIPDSVRAYDRNR